MRAEGSSELRDDDVRLPDQGVQLVDARTLLGELRLHALVLHDHLVVLGAAMGQLRVDAADLGERVRGREGESVRA